MRYYIMNQNIDMHEQDYYVEQLSETKHKE